MTPPLRPYQIQARDAAINSWNLSERPICVMPTGGGKTITACSIATHFMDGNNRLAFLAHRKELIDQTFKKFLDFDILPGIIRAQDRENLDYRRMVQVCSVQTLVQRLDLGFNFSHLMFDECFPRGTMVGDKPIEEIRVGDFVPSWDGKETVRRRVTKTMVRTSRELVRITVGNREVFSTPYHPFFTLEFGWMPAHSLAGLNVLMEDDYVPRFNPMLALCDYLFSAHSLPQREALHASREYLLLGSMRGGFQAGDFIPHDARYESPPLGYFVGTDEGEKSKAQSRREENRVLEFNRVDGIEIHKFGSHGVPTGMRGENQNGFEVFNLAVEETETYTANGFIVHNCHHTPAATFHSIIKRFPDARVMGFTATPYRLDGNPLGNHYDVLQVAATTAELIEQGFLVPAIYVSARIQIPEDSKPTPMIVGSIQNEWLTHAPNRPTLGFGVTVDQCRNVSEAFNALGVRSEVLCDETDDDDREDMLRRFRLGLLPRIENVGVLTEGTDIPICSCIQIYRPIASRSVYKQIIGRGSRPFSCGDFRKENFIIIDHGGNKYRHGEFADPERLSLTQSPFTLLPPDDPKDPKPIQCFSCDSSFMRDDAIYIQNFTNGSTETHPACPYCGQEVSDWRRKIIHDESVKLSIAQAHPEFSFTRRLKQEPMEIVAKKSNKRAPFRILRD